MEARTVVQLLSRLVARDEIWVFERVPGEYVSGSGIIPCPPGRIFSTHNSRQSRGRGMPGYDHPVPTGRAPFWTHPGPESFRGWLQSFNPFGTTNRHYCLRYRLHINPTEHLRCP